MKSAPSHAQLHRSGVIHMKTNTIASKKASNTGITTRRSMNGVTVKCGIEDVRKRAFEMSAQGKSYDDYIWLLAESEARFSKACLEAGKNAGDGFKIDPELVVDKVDEKEIRQLAEKYAKAHPKVQDLHWYIAERLCALEGAKQVGKK